VALTLNPKNFVKNLFQDRQGNYTLNPKKWLDMGDPLGREKARALDAKKKNDIAETVANHVAVATRNAVIQALDKM